MDHTLFWTVNGASFVLDSPLYPWVLGLVVVAMLWRHIRGPWGAAPQCLCLACTKRALLWTLAAAELAIWPPAVVFAVLKLVLSVAPDRLQWRIFDCLGWCMSDGEQSSVGTRVAAIICAVSYPVLAAALFLMVRALAGKWPPRWNDVPRPVRLALCASLAVVLYDTYSLLNNLWPPSELVSDLWSSSLLLFGRLLPLWLFFDGLATVRDLTRRRQCQPSGRA
jgi:hypothetical protein